MAEPKTSGGAARVFAIALLVGLAAVPLVAAWLNQPFWVTLFTRILVFALAAMGLNLVLGFGAMVSFGHAMYLGLGAYAVGILSHHGIDSGIVQLLAALVVGSIVALAVGAICLRTSGMAFIMITLAFAQMLFYIFVSLKGYGGDDGLPLAKRSPLGTLKMADDTVFYYVVLALLALCLVFLARLRDSRFGRVLRGIKDNEVRMESLGYATLRFKLTAFVIAGAMAGLAGALMANQNGFVSPNMLHWDLSGTALVMVILGGLGSLWGGLAGAVVFMVLEEVLTSFTSHWQIILGLILLGVVFFAPKGIAGLFARKAR